MELGEKGFRMKKKGIIYLCLFVLTFTLFPWNAIPISFAEESPDQQSISDFESLTDWRGLLPEEEIVKQGTRAGLWDIYNPVTNKYSKAADNLSIQNDWSQYEALSVWVYSKKATNDKIYVILNSDNAGTDKSDYYLSSFHVDWEGWKEITIPYYMFKAAYSPAGFSKIDSIRFHTSWQQEIPNQDTELILDQLTINKLSQVSVLPIDGFEDAGKWTSITASQTHVKKGLYSGKWEGINTKKNVQTTAIPANWSQYDYMSLWLYSEKATGTPIYVILDSDNPATSGLDYYLSSITVDWTGWKQVNIPRSSFAPSRQPLGWEHIQQLKFHSQWYADQPPNPETVLYFDDLKLVQEVFQVSPKQVEKKLPPGMSAEYKIKIMNKSSQTDQYTIDIPTEMQDYVSVDEPSGEIKTSETKIVTFTVKVREDAEIGDEKEMTIPIASRLQLGVNFEVKLAYKVTEWQQSSHTHPKSFIGSEQLQRAKERINTKDWAAVYWQKIKKEADGWLTKNTSVLSESGGHGMWFLCNDGERLQYNADSPHRHYCPTEDTYYTGESYDAGWRYYRHNELVRAIKVLSVAYALSDDQKYSDEAASILLQYANLYPNWEKQTRGGRLHWQTLDEAVNLVDISYSYDLLYNSGSLTDQQKANIELNLLRPSAVTISEYDMGRSNWQAWHNTAIGMIGFVLGDKELMEFAINGEHGFHYHMDTSVLEDGFWWEGSIAYHIYTLRALNYLAEGAKNWGYDLYSNPSFKKMFDMPFSYAYPNFTLPFNNDGGGYGSSLVDPVSERGDYEYEAAFAYYDDPMYGWLLNERYAKVPREGDYALFHGKEEISRYPVQDIVSKNFKNVGYSILRSGTYPNQNYVLMDYGPYGGSHGHPDKLHLDIYGQNSILAPDFGTPSYGNFLYRDWYKQTISHNTITVDGKSQAEVQGELKRFIDLPNFKMMTGTADKAYSGVSYERTVWVDEEYIIDWFDVADPIQPHQYDWTLHGLGSFATNQPLVNREEKLGSIDGYQHILNPKSSGLIESWEGAWNQIQSSLYVISLPFGEREMVVADASGPSIKPNNKIPMVLQRKSGKEARFVTVLQPFTQEAKKVKAVKEGENGVRVDTPEHSDHFYYNPKAEIGDLISAKATSSIGKKIILGEKIQSAVSNQTLTLTMDSEELLHDAVLIVKAEQVEEVLVNGIKVNFKQDGDHVILELAAFKTVSDNHGKPVSETLPFKSNEKAVHLLASGHANQPISVDLNQKKMMIPPSDTSKTDLSPYVKEGVNNLTWEVRGKPEKSITIIIQ